MHDSAQIASMIHVCNAVDLGIEEASHNDTTYILHPESQTYNSVFYPYNLASHTRHCALLLSNVLFD